MKDTTNTGSGDVTFSSPVYAVEKKSPCLQSCSPSDLTSYLL